MLIYQTAAYDGDITERQRLATVADMSAAFDADEELAEGLFAFARMAVSQINDAGNSVRKILAPVREVCTATEKQTLIDMLDRAAEVEGPPSKTQRRLIADARRVLVDV